MVLGTGASWLTQVGADRASFREGRQDAHEETRRAPPCKDAAAARELEAAAPGRQLQQGAPAQESCGKGVIYVTKRLAAEYLYTNPSTELSQVRGGGSLLP